MKLLAVTVPRVIMIITHKLMIVLNVLFFVKHVYLILYAKNVLNLVKLCKVMVFVPANKVISYNKINVFNVIFMKKNA